MAPLNLKDYIRDIPDFPTPGILFRDITPLLKDTRAFRSTIDMFAERYTDAHLDAALEHLDAMTEMARRHLERDEDDSDRMQGFAEEMRVYILRHVSPNAAAQYDSAAPFKMCWLGLARYWKKRGVGVP